MSKLANLRGNNNNSQAAMFSNDVDTATKSIFARMRGEKSTTPANPQRKKYTPSRFRVKAGETKSLIILDTVFTHAHREHAVKGQNGFWSTKRCIADYDSCPVCALPDNRPADVVFLTVLDLTPWEKDGKTFDFTKRVLGLKKNDYESMQTIASTQGNNLRGVMLDMTRGHDKKESGVGKPTFVNKLSEDDLIEQFGSPEKVYPSGFVLAANNAIQIFNYSEIFEVPTRDELAAELGMAPRPGSKAEAANMDEDNSPPWNEEEIETLDLSAEYPDVD